jgi:hypothetical protein
MSLLKFSPRTGLLAGMILLVTALRILNNLSHELTTLSNYSPLVAMALFGGAYFKGTVRPLAFPLLAILASDLFLFATVYKSYGHGFLYIGWGWVYAAFLLIAWSGKLLIKKVNAPTLAVSILIGVLIHWVVTDIGVWLHSTGYAQNWAGFTACLGAAIPFELRLLAATVAYGALMFGSFEWMKRKYPVLQVC